MNRVKFLLMFIFLLICISGCSHTRGTEPVEKPTPVTPEVTPTPVPEETYTEETEPPSAQESETSQEKRFPGTESEKSSQDEYASLTDMAGQITDTDVKADEQGNRYYNFSDIVTDAVSDAPVELNMEDMDIRTIILNFCQLLKKNVILHPQVTGTITIQTTTPVPNDKLWDVLLSILEMNHISVVKSGEYWKFVPSSEIQFRPATTTVGREAGKIYPHDKMITHIAPLNYISPSEAMALLGQLKSKDGNIINYEPGKLLIITDYASSVHRLLRVLELVDLDTSLNDIDIIQLQYADAADVKATIDAIFQSKVSISTLVPQAQPATRGGRPTSPTQLGGTGSTGPLIFTDSRSNSLIIFGHKSDIEFIHSVIDLLDINIYKNLKTYIYYVENAKATDLANVLNTVFGQQSQMQESSTRSSSRSSRSARQERGGRTPQRQPVTPPGGTGANAASLAAGGLVEGEVQLTADERTNALIITTIPSNWPIIEDIIKKLDITPKQVLIEVLIAEISLDDSTKYGIEWTLKSQDSVTVGGKKYYLDSVSTQEMGLNRPSADNPSGGNLGLVWNVFEANRFMALLNAYAQHSKLKIISSPHILVTNNVEATFNFGEQVPIISSTSTDTTSQSRFNTVQYQDTGVILTVTPLINTDRVVSLEVTQEVSTAQSNTVANIESPIIQTRKVSTTVVVRDNHTLVIGGMIQDRDTASTEGVPWIYKIPLLGKLFGATSNSSGTTELVIMITPHVVLSTQEADSQTETFKEKIQDLKEYIEAQNNKKQKKNKFRISSD